MSDISRNGSVITTIDEKKNKQIYDIDDINLQVANNFIYIYNNSNHLITKINFKSIKDKKGAKNSTDFLNFLLNSESVNDYDNKSLSQVEGLFLNPDITCLKNIGFKTNTTDSFIIEGHNFSPQTSVIFETSEIKVNKISYINSTQLIVNITVSDKIGTYNFRLNNLNLEHTSINPCYIKVDNRNTDWVDFRSKETSEYSYNKDNSFVDSEDIKIESDGFYIEGKSKWDRILQFRDYNWVRNEDRSFSFIIKRLGNFQAMIGLGYLGSPLSSNNGRAYYNCEYAININNNRISNAYGGGSGSNYTENIPATYLDVGYYKIEFIESAKRNTLIRISIIDIDNNWDSDGDVVREYYTMNPGTSSDLIPIILPKNNSKNYRLVGFKIN